MEVMNVRVPKDVKTQIKQIARSERTTQSEIFRRLLDLGLLAREIDA